MRQIHTLIVSFMAVAMLSIATAASAAPDKIQGNETIVIIGNCTGGQVMVDLGNAESECRCPPGESMVLGQCMSKGLSDFFDDAWNDVCKLFDCTGSGSGPDTGDDDPTDCKSNEGAACDAEFAKCDAEFAAGVDICNTTNRNTAISRCNQNVWPGHHITQDWHKVDGYWCPNPTDDPTSITSLMTTPAYLQCKDAKQVHAQCLDAWLSNETKGSGGGATFLGIGASGSDGGSIAGPLSPYACLQEESKRVQTCKRDVVLEKGCPVSCESVPKARVILGDFRPEHHDRSYSRVERMVLTEITRQEAETFINDMGYAWLEQRQLHKAIEAFETNVVNFPTSANAHDSLAEGYERAGRKRLALKYYRQALRLDPKLVTAKEGIARLSP
jgi:hypothetical protein